MKIETNLPLESLAIKALEDLKAQNIVKLDVRSLTTITDTMLISTGTSDQHIRSIGAHVLHTVKNAGYSLEHPQDLDTGDWVLIDLGDVVVHIMRQSARDYYALEKLWDIDTEEKRANLSHSAQA